MVEEHGVVDGVYRLSGVASNIHRLRARFDNDAANGDAALNKNISPVHRGASQFVKLAMIGILYSKTLL